MIIFTVLGVAMVLWWTLGIVLTATMVKSYIPPEAPMSARMGAMFNAGFVVPHAIITTGRLPLISVIPDQMTAEQQKAFDEWREGICNCPACRARRGGK